MVDMNNLEVHFSSRSSEWGTPWPLFHKLEELFGKFTLDPCATRENAKCEKFFTREDDGLRKSWHGHRVFMNPPYGREITKWIRKAYDEARDESTMVVCLIPTRTDTRWWHECVMKADEIWFIRGRVKFQGARYPAPFPSAVVVFRNPPASPTIHSLLI